VLKPDAALVKHKARIQATEQAFVDLKANEIKRKQTRLDKIEAALALAASELVNTKFCTKCKRIFPLTEFGIRKARANNPTSHCKFCMSEKAMNRAKSNPERRRQKDREYYAKNKEKFLNPEARLKHNILSELSRIRNRARDRLDASNRRALKKNATPIWSNSKYIKLFFDMAQEAQIETGKSYHVDHIVPLKSKYVTGFHCEDNLQVLPSEENLIKHNTWWPDMWEIT
jgi:hypothetical protein